MTASGRRAALAALQEARHPGWPARLGPIRTSAGLVSLRPLQRSDGSAWRSIRVRDERVISPWDATSVLSWPARHTRVFWRLHRSGLVSAARRGEVLPFAITVDEDFAGQVTVGGIQRGALKSAWIGYWVDSTLHRHGVATGAVRLAVKHVLNEVGLHRLEATIAPENFASLAVVRHLGFRQEGYLEKYLDINGAWRDHLLFAITIEDLARADQIAPLG